MDAFSYLSVLLSIIIGLAITQILSGYRAALLARRQVRHALPTWIWSGLILLMSVQLWWASFGLASHRSWTFVAFAAVLLQTALLYMMAALVLPDMPAGEPIDLPSHYRREITPFYSLLLAMLAVSIVKDVVLNGELPETENLAFHGLVAGIAITALANRRSGVHAALAIVTAVLILVYIGLLFARL